MKNRKPQKPDPQSVSTEAGLAATTRYPSGRPVGGGTFLLTSPFIERLWSLVNLWDVRDESLMVGHFLDVPGRVERVYQQAVHLGPSRPWDCLSSGLAVSIPGRIDKS